MQSTGAVCVHSMHAAAGPSAVKSRVRSLTGVCPGEISHQQPGAPQHARSNAYNLKSCNYFC
jgi:hypothetical protein